MWSLLPSTAAPGVEQLAAQLADHACALHDAVGPERWNRAAAEDAVETIETTAQALASTHPEAGDILTPILQATADLRRRLHLPPADDAPAEDTTAPSPTSTPPGAPRASQRRRQRRTLGLGPRWQGIQQPGTRS
ncbi:hypothetical protein OG858_47050 (plasmid) [Streptomyces europaeiscabiei]|uniref:hypothetical protein n=1 Tax=Streptomyces europaeiscabiei TaxID=146819 RepID=UPI002E7FDA4F|nr:hypothetical protein [Streptomyces europaeiscabiei]WUD38866.1 hypothetical protein OG858_47050 [Streptomyces europaeiscabiei]